MLSLPDILTKRFYQWEQIGRGWHIFPYPVEIEPPYTPFLGHDVSGYSTVEDSKQHTFVSRAIDFLTRKKSLSTVEPQYEFPDPDPFPIQADEPLVAFNITFTADITVEAYALHQLLLMLMDTLYPVSFEIYAEHEYISMQFVIRAADASSVAAQMDAHFPEVQLSVDWLDSKQRSTLKKYVIEYGLCDEFMRPMRAYGKGDPDPYVGLLAAMATVSQDEAVVFQTLFQGTHNPWAESIMRVSTDNNGGAFFANAPEMLKEAKDKVSMPLFAACVRVIGFASTAQRAQDITIPVGIAIERISTSASNRLIPIHASDNPQAVEDVFLRCSHRLGMLLNSYELTTLVHIPEAETIARYIPDTRKTKELPQIAIGHDFSIGINSHLGQDIAATVPPGLRLKHTHIIGATGTGKSTLLISMIVQDMQQGNACAVLDPHGDLIESILQHIPKNRLQDVVLVDPADGEYPVAFNILSAHSDIEKEILASDLVAAFRRLSTSWGDQMNSVFANAILAFLESTEGGTLADLRRFLIEKPYRDTYLKTVADPHIVYYWQHEYPLLKSSSLGSILTRLDTFLRPKPIRNMVAQKKGLDFEHIMDNKKILLVKLSQGLLGAENSYLLGTFFVSKIYQSAMARQAQSKSNRNDFFLYIDEFQHFITPSMSHILSGARKYHLGLILAHQGMAQLQTYDTELANSIMVNAGTRICFRLGDTDAKRIASGFSYFDAADFENLGTGEAIAKMEQPNQDFSLTTITLPEVLPDVAETITHAVIEMSRTKYATPKHIVEDELGKLNIRPIQYLQTQAEQNIPIEVSKETPLPITPPHVPIIIDPSQNKVKPKVSSKSPVTQHRYIQTLVKHIAEARGYIATLEEVTPDGNGRVDVSLKKNGKRIACEVSVTTDKIWETHNVIKCLAAGYDQVIVCSNDLKHLESIKEQLKIQLDEKQLSKILVLEPNEIGLHFDKLITQEASTTRVVKGYRVRVEFGSNDSLNPKKGK